MCVLRGVLMHTLPLPFGGMVCLERVPCRVPRVLPKTLRANWKRNCSPKASTNSLKRLPGGGHAHTIPRTCSTRARRLLPWLLAAATSATGSALALTASIAGASGAKMPARMAAIQKVADVLTRSKSVAFLTVSAPVSRSWHRHRARAACVRAGGVVYGVYVCVS